jgi:RNA polymerase sigma factor (sigma-70 family)
MTECLALSDADLLRACRERDERALSALVERYRPAVYRACRFGLPAADADDATQAVFLIMLDKPEDAARAPSLAAWLGRVSSFVVSTARRSRHRRQRAELAAAAQADRADSGDHDDPRRNELADALHELPEHERVAISLHYLLGHTLAEVGAHMRRPANTVNTWIRRGLERLRGKLERKRIALASAAIAALLVESAEAAQTEFFNRDHQATRPADAFRAHQWARGTMRSMTMKYLLTPALLTMTILACSAWLPVSDHAGNALAAAEPTIVPAQSGNEIHEGVFNVTCDVNSVPEGCWVVATIQTKMFQDAFKADDVRAASREMRSPIDGHENRIERLTFCADKSYLAVIYQGKSLWDPEQETKFLRAMAETPTIGTIKHYRGLTFYVEASFPGHVFCPIGEDLAIYGSEALVSEILDVAAGTHAHLAPDGMVRAQFELTPADADVRIGGDLSRSPVAEIFTKIGASNFRASISAPDQAINYSVVLHTDAAGSAQAALEVVRAQIEQQREEWDGFEEAIISAALAAATVSADGSDIVISGGITAEERTTLDAMIRTFVN